MIESVMIMMNFSLFSVICFERIGLYPCMEFCPLFAFYHFSLSKSHLLPIQPLYRKEISLCPVI